MEAKKQRPPTIRAACAFDAKIYKIVDDIFNVSPCLVWNKKKFHFSDFCFQLPALLIDLLEKILSILSATEGTEDTEICQIINRDRIYQHMIFLVNPT